jgi:hypothetical protein
MSLKKMAMIGWLAGTISQTYLVGLNVFAQKNRLAAGILSQVWRPPILSQKNGE